MTDFRLICEDWNAEILAARRPHCEFRRKRAG
jgi:hypothetical protein